MVSTTSDNMEDKTTLAPAAIPATAPSSTAAPATTGAVAGVPLAAGAGPMPGAPTEPTTGLVSLYVGDLHPDVTESTLFEHFNATVGAVASIRVCRNAVTRRSLCYAYVNFNTHDEARRALDELNNEELKGRPMRIMWSHRDPSLRRSGNGNIFIKNLEKSIDNKSLYDTFADFGDILSCKVVTDEHGESKGFGFVHFVRDADADKAIEMVNGKMIAGQQIFAAKFVSKRDRQMALGSKALQFTNVFVKNLPTSMDEDGLKKLCEDFGVVSSHVIMKDDNNTSKGFGFVNFETPEAAAAAVDGLNGKEVGGNTLYAGRAQKKTERRQLLETEHMSRRRELEAKTQGVNLYVKNLDESIDDEELRKAFADFGNITSAKVMVDSKGVSRGFGFVCFSAPEEATKAVTEMNGKIVAVKPLYVALAQRKQDRAAFINSQRATRMQYRQQMSMGIPMYYPNPGQMRSYGPPMAYPPQMGPGPRGNRGGWQAGGPGGPMGGMSMGPMRSMPPTGGLGGAPNGGRSGPGGRRGGNGAVPGGRGGGLVGPSGPGGRQGGGKLNPNVRMPPSQMFPPFDQLFFATLDNQSRRQYLGEALFPRVQLIAGDGVAGKITGMLLEMDHKELVSLIDDQQGLQDRVDEAIRVLQEHNPPRLDVA
jgi:polyadenylate-binding protein